MISFSKKKTPMHAKENVTRVRPCEIETARASEIAKGEKTSRRRGGAYENRISGAHDTV